MVAKSLNRRMVIVFLLIAIVLSLLSIIIGLTATNSTGFKSSARSSQQSGGPYGSLGFVIEGSDADSNSGGLNGAR